MVYIYQHAAGQTLTLPNASATQASGDLTFELIGEASGLPVYSSAVSVVPVWGGLYYSVPLGDTRDIPEGEMRYELRDGVVVVANGVARVLRYREEPQQDGAALNIIQYE